MKDGRVALSFGYLVTDQVKREDGVTELRELDLFEISIVPAPANEDTKILSTKAADRLGYSREQWELLEILNRPREEVERRAAETKTAQVERKSVAIRVATFDC
jgi:phage head maturation protease